jgi:hypothetical protein
MPNLATVAFALFMLAIAAPARSGENETYVAARNFIAALTELDDSLRRYHDLVKAAGINSYEAPALCAEVTPDPENVPDEHVPLEDLLKKNKISLSDARTLCRAFAAERSSIEKAKAANLAAATECAAHRVPACDQANEAVAAQKASRARMTLGGPQ